MGIRLSVREPGRDERRMEFAGTKVTIGSDPLCDISLPDAGLEREQAVLVLRGRTIELFDIGENGDVRVNGRVVRHTDLRPGDEVAVGVASLKLLPTEAGISLVESVSTVRAVYAAGKIGRGDALPKGQERHVLVLNELGRLIRAIGHNEDVFESILDTFFAAIPVRRAFLALVADDGELKVKAQRDGERRSTGKPIEVSRTMIRKVLDSGEAVLTADAEADPQLAASQSIQRLRIKAAVAVPLVVRGKVGGLLYGDNREEPGALDREDLAMLSALSGVAAVAIEKLRLMQEYDAKLKLEQALAIARSIHRNFLPSAPPELAGLDVWGRSESCDETGGDYYDYFVMEDGRLGVVVGDVTGHGVGPALLMASVRAGLRALLAQTGDLEDLLFRLNNLMRDDVHDGRFVTLFYGVVDAARRSFRHVGAGHIPPLWYRAAAGASFPVPSLGPPLGVLPALRFPAGDPLDLAPGDVLLFPTDGILEAANGSGERFGAARLQEVLADHAGGGAREVVEAVYAAVDAFSGHKPLRDDATCVAVRVL